MLRVISGGVVIAGCSLLGILFSSSFKKRVCQLVELQSALSQLEFDITFRTIPLSESLFNMGSQTEGAICEMFMYISERLTKERCVDVYKLWQRAVKRVRDSLFLTDEDLDVLMAFSKKLGSGDRQCERDNIKMALARLKMAEEEAEEIARRNTKVYRGMGVLVGIFIVIVLI